MHVKAKGRLLFWFRPRVAMMAIWATDTNHTYENPAMSFDSWLLNYRVKRIFAQWRISAYILSCLDGQLSQPLRSITGHRVYLYKHNTCIQQWIQETTTSKFEDFIQNKDSANIT